ncbi:MAG TPA: hypothetical protein VFH83_04070 [Spirochaetia bacterium]|nr:hypothetical protein [Spirochaetia bacterium]
MGRADFGQLGTGATADVLTPTQILAGGVVAIAGGLVHTAIIKADHSIWTTGYSSNGELGNGSSSGSLTFVQIRRPSLAPGDP